MGARVLYTCGSVVHLRVQVMHNMLHAVYNNIDDVVVMYPQMQHKNFLLPCARMISRGKVIMLGVHIICIYVYIYKYVYKNKI